MSVSTRRPELRCSSYSRSASICILVLLLASLGTVGLCQNRESSQASNPETGCDVTYSSPVDNQPLALQRYRTLKQVEHSFGNFPLYGPTDAQHNVLFPRGKGDKVYVYVPGLGYTGDNVKEQLFCYESKGDEAKLLYTVKLKRVNFRPPKYRIAVRSILDYISTLGYGSHRDRSLNGGAPRTYSFAVSGYIKDNVKHDLSLKQDLVFYRLGFFYSKLTVKCFNSKVAAEDIPEQLYEIPEKGDMLNDEQWYETYGLPIADCELSAESKHTGKQK